jgi:hypothetical protein
VPTYVADAEAFLDRGTKETQVLFEGYNLGY